MPFSPEQKNDFLTFLRDIDKSVATKLPPKEAGEFFTTIIDYSVTDEAFEIKIALIFYKIPEMLGDLKDSIKNLSIVREAMLDDSGVNADEAKELTLEFFTDRIDEFWELAYYEELEEEHELNAAEKKRRNDRKTEKRRMEKDLQELKEERQTIFEVEKEERIKRKEEKKSEESAVQVVRQKEHDTSVVERKERKARIEDEISELQEGLQIQHNKTDMRNFSYCTKGKEGGGAAYHNF